MRPYLLKKFKRRGNDEVGRLAKQDFQRIRKSLISYLKSDYKGKVDLPKTFGTAFINAVEEFECRFDIVAVNGKPQAAIRDIYLEFDSAPDFTVPAGYLDDIANGEMRDLAADFLRALFLANSYNNEAHSVVGSIFDYVSYYTENEGFMDYMDEEEKGSCLGIITCAEKEIENASKIIDKYHLLDKTRNVDCDALKERAASFTASDNKESELLAAIREGIRFISDLPYRQERNVPEDSCYNDSVTVTPDDSFTVGYKAYDLLDDLLYVILKDESLFLDDERATMCRKIIGDDGKPLVLNTVNEQYKKFHTQLITALSAFEKPTTQCQQQIQ